MECWHDGGLSTAQGGGVLIKPAEEGGQPGEAGEPTVLSGAPVRHIQTCQATVCIPKYFQLCSP